MSHTRQSLLKSFQHAFEGIIHTIKKERNINTAIEAVVDLASPDIHLLAKLSKDAAAGAVLISAIISAIIGLMIFIPYII